MLKGKAKADYMRGYRTAYMRRYRTRRRDLVETQPSVGTHCIETPDVETLHGLVSPIPKPSRSAPVVQPIEFDVDGNPIYPDQGGGIYLDE